MTTIVNARDKPQSTWRIHAIRMRVLQEQVSLLLKKCGLCKDELHYLPEHDGCFSEILDQQNHLTKQIYHAQLSISCFCFERHSVFSRFLSRNSDA